MLRSVGMSDSMNASMSVQKSQETGNEKHVDFIVTLVELAVEHEDELAERLDISEVRS